MKNQSTQKWYHTLQDQIKARIDASNYSRVGYCLFQEVTKDRYFECWDLRHNSTGEYEQCLFVAFKASGFIFTYINKNSTL